MTKQYTSNNTPVNSSDTAEQKKVINRMQKKTAENRPQDGTKAVDYDGR